MNEFKFDLQRFWRDAESTTYQGSRRWSGNWGRVWLDNDLVFELNSFEANVVADRDDVIVEASKDTKIVSLTGEGTLTIKKVFNRGFSNMLERWKNGNDVRVSLVATLKDPDMLHEGEERIEIHNVWFNQLELMKFEKGSVVETEIPFGFRPQDASFTNTVER